MIVSVGKVQVISHQSKDGFTGKQVTKIRKENRDVSTTLTEIKDYKMIT